LNRLPASLSVIGSKMKQIDPSFEIKTTTLAMSGGFSRTLDRPC